MGETMTAIEISAPGGPEVLVPAIRPLPKAGEVLVRVTAAGVNRPVVLQRQGAYPLPARYISMDYIAERLTLR